MKVIPISPGYPPDQTIDAAWALLCAKNWPGCTFPSSTIKAAQAHLQHYLKRTGRQQLFIQLLLVPCTSPESPDLWLHPLYQQGFSVKRKQYYDRHLRERGYAFGCTTIEIFTGAVSRFLKGKRRSILDRCYADLRKRKAYMLARLLADFYFHF